MKYLKYFENEQNEPKIGDYVIIKFKDEENEDLIEFLEKNIGRIEFVGYGYRESFYRVIFKNMPDELKSIYGQIIAYDNNIVFYAKKIS